MIDIINITNRKLQRKARSLMFWLSLSRDEVLNVFAKIPGAERIGTGDNQFIYISGKRQNKVVLVCHADTVWDIGSGRSKDFNIKFDNGKYYSADKLVGIGADDRAGCSILWRLRESGHSLVILASEEGGCTGAKFLATQKKYIDNFNNEHQFAIEIDRKNTSDLIFYEIGESGKDGKEFVDWCELNFKGYKKDRGSGTDIKYLCKDICGVNISCGFFKEHSNEETLLISAWKRTLDTIREVINQKDIPKFKLQKKYGYTGYGQNYNNNNNNNNNNNTKVETSQHEESQSYYQDGIMCNSCKTILDISEVMMLNDMKICRYCSNDVFI